MPLGSTEGGGASRRVGRVSLRARVALWVVTVFVLIQGTTTGLLWLYERDRIVDAFDERLIARTRRTAAEVVPLVPSLGPNRLEDIAQLELGVLPISRFLVGVLDERGRPVVADEDMRELLPQVSAVARGTNSAPQVVEATAPSAWAGEDGSPRSLRAVLFPLDALDGTRYVLAIAVEEAVIAAQHRLLGQIVVLMLFVGILAAAVSGWFIGGVAVAPFELLGRLVRQLRPESIGEELALQESNPEMERLRRELDEARRRMERGFAAQERFLANVSHELKTPISTLLTEAQTIGAERLPPEGREFVESVAAEMRRLGQLIESFLTLTRVRNGGSAVRPTPIAVNDLAIEGVERCVPAAMEQRVRLVPHLLESGGSTEARVLGDPALLATMLENLLRNAIRFSPPEEPVELILARDLDQVRIAVRDRGPGIPPDRLETIFDRFAQTPEERRRGRGNGLGLSIATGIAELHGGTIAVRNNADRGCVFVVTLPLANGASAVSDAAGTAGEDE